jgi:methylmalonyl-CoA/ethylmalonyl-CoA epimerase
VKFKHLGIAVADLDAVLEFYKDLFGYKVLSGPFDDPIHKVSVCFVGTGDRDEFTIELVAPLGCDSPVHHMVANQISAYHVCYEVKDVDEALKAVQSKGCMILSRPLPAIAFDGRRIAWFYTPNRQLVELLEQ